MPNIKTVVPMTEPQKLSFPTLVVFCKRPKLHQGKQRLVQTITSEQALIVAKGLLACAVEDTQNWQGPVVIACSDENDIEWAQSLNNKAQVITQLPSGVKGNLGQRLNYVDEKLRSCGHQHIITIGTDAPILGHHHYQAVIASLYKHDIVLSHADDGGVVIMANSQLWPNIIDLPWSTDKLSQVLAKTCTEQGLGVDYTLPGYDIDLLTDIEKLIQDLQHDTRPARQAMREIAIQLFVTSGEINHA
jgi:glycosyltransferase A (GT-A) superfamily protein (DUF2064 family)